MRLMMNKQSLTSTSTSSSSSSSSSSSKILSSLWIHRILDSPFTATSLSFTSKCTPVWSSVVGSVFNDRMKLCSRRKNTTAPVFRKYLSSAAFLFTIFIQLICINIIIQLASTVEAVSYWRKLAPIPADLKLGNPCRSSLECLLFVPNSQCDCNKGCTCQPYHVLYNDTMCLPTSLLGYACTVDEQCSTRVSNAECNNGLCQCKTNFLPLRRDKCLPPAKSGDFCINDHQCILGSRYSRCKYIIPRIYGKCRCLDGYHLTTNEGCLPSLKSQCNETINECDKVTPNSHCQAYTNGPSICQCNPGFKESDDQLSCQLIPTTEPTTQTIDEFDDENTIEDEINEDNESKVANANAVSLGKPCNHSFECQLRDPYSKCNNGICDCIKPTETCSANHTECYDDTFQCRNGQCVSWYFVCDKNKNCDDNSDEADCVPFHCPKEAFQCKSDGVCLPRSVVCNGKMDCEDGSDEAKCAQGQTCDKQAWQCKSGQCLPQYGFCNAVNDCLDGSDEDEDICDNSTTCPDGTFTCTNRLCRSTAILCSGVDGCGDNSDEEKCEVCFCQKP